MPRMNRGRFPGRNTVHHIFNPIGLLGRKKTRTLCGLINDNIYEICNAIPVTCKRCIKAYKSYGITIKEEQ